MIPINYVLGDATRPFGTGRKIIAHVCNSWGGWGAGFVLALSQINRMPEWSYRDWCRASWRTDILPAALQPDHPFKLGEVQFAPFQSEVYVCNMVAQRATPSEGGVFLDYAALEKCLRKLAEAAISAECSVHMPRIGCGLAGGKWEYVEPIIYRHLCRLNVEVTVYDLP